MNSVKKGPILHYLLPTLGKITSHLIVTGLFYTIFAYFWLNTCGSALLVQDIPTHFYAKLLRFWPLFSILCEFCTFFVNFE